MKCVGLCVGGAVAVFGVHQDICVSVKDVNPLVPKGDFLKYAV
jgi:hypothetical protein